METTKQQKYELTENKKYYFNNRKFDDKERCTGYAIGYQKADYYTDGYDPDLAAYELTQIRALRDIPEKNIKRGDLGGWVLTGEFDPGPENFTKKWLPRKPGLSQEGNCWLDEKSLLFCGTIEKDAQVKNSKIKDSHITDKAFVIHSNVEGSEIRDFATIVNCKLYYRDVLNNTKMKTCNSGYMEKTEANSKYFKEERDGLDYRSFFTGGNWERNKLKEHKKEETKERPKVNLKPKLKKISQSKDMER